MSAAGCSASAAARLDPRHPPFPSPYPTVDAPAGTRGQTQRVLAQPGPRPWQRYAQRFMSMDTDTPFWPPLLSKLIRGEELTADEAGGALATILEGRATPAQIAGFAVLLRAKGETPAEMAALVRTMLAYAERVDVAGPLLDTCGTGGDRSCTINVSTLAAFVAAGAGARVAKHGNRSASSACGSADLLERLGVAVDLGPVGVARCIDEVGIGFCYAPRYHPALRHAGPVRADLGVPTTFNFLGPLANPAGARRQTIGVGDAAMAERMVATLVELGTERALVFFGHDGLDELTTTTTSAVWEVIGAEVHFWNLDPTELGIPLAVPEDLVGGDPTANARLGRAVLDGDAGPQRDIVVLNAGAALVAAGVVEDLAAGVEAASASLDGGRAAAALDQLVKVSQEAAAEAAG